MTAPDNLSAWKDDLLRDLMLRTRAYFRGEPARRRSARAATRARRAAQLDPGGARDRRRHRSAPVRPADAAPGRAPRRSSSAARTRKRRAIALEVHCFPIKGHSELAIVAPDAPGVLAAIAGALTANRVDVLGAVLGHVEPAHGRARARRVLRARPQGRGDPRRRSAVAQARRRSARAARGPPDRAEVAQLIARQRPPSRPADAGDAGRRHRDPAPRRLDAGDDRRGRRRAIASACSTRSRRRSPSSASTSRSRRSRPRARRSPTCST